MATQRAPQEEPREEAGRTHFLRSARQLGARGVEGDGGQRPLVGRNRADCFLLVERNNGYRCRERGTMDFPSLCFLFPSETPSLSCPSPVSPSSSPFTWKLYTCSGVSRLCIKGHAFASLVLPSGRGTPSCAWCGVMAQLRALPTCIFRGLPPATLPAL